MLYTSKTAGTSTQVRPSLKVRGSYHTQYEPRIFK